MIEEIKIENMIYEIRDKQVMLDSDLAKLYGCKNGTKEVNQAVKRNVERFPEDFYFQLTSEEFDYILKSQFVTSKIKGAGGVRKLPHVFTEQGVAMLATVLKTVSASKVSIKIMRTFVEIRKFINENKDIFSRLTKVEYKMIEYDEKIDKLFASFNTKKIFRILDSGLS